MNEPEQTGTTPEADALAAAARMPLVGSRLVEEAGAGDGGEAFESVQTLPEGVPLNVVTFMESRWQYVESPSLNGTAWIVVEGDNVTFTPGVMIMDKLLAAFMVDEHNRGMVRLHEEQEEVAVAGEEQDTAQESFVPDDEAESVRHGLVGGLGETLGEDSMVSRESDVPPTRPHMAFENE